MVDGIDKLQDKNLADHRLARFPNVSKICFSSQDTDVVANHEFLWTVIQMCSRATDLDLRNVKINLIGDLFFLLTHGRGCDATLYRRLWLKAGTHLSLTGDDFCGAKNLREVYLDSVVFFYDGPFKQVKFTKFFMVLKRSLDCFTSTPELKSSASREPLSLTLSTEDPYHKNSSSSLFAQTRIYVGFAVTLWSILWPC